MADDTTSDSTTTAGCKCSDCGNAANPPDCCANVWGGCDYTWGCPKDYYVGDESTGVCEKCGDNAESDASGRYCVSVC